MSQAYKVCPICGTPAHPNAVLCTTCGATLSDVAPVETKRRNGARPNPSQIYDDRYGETDLYEGALGRNRNIALFSGALVLAIVVCGALVLVLGSRFLTSSFAPATATPSITPVPTQVQVAATSTPIALTTNTPRPAPGFATVTPAPPTATPLPPPTQCSRIVQQGDTLYAIALACGHRDAAVIDLIVEQNELSSANALQLGQEIIVPPPTPTTDPNLPAEVPATEGGQGGGGETAEGMAAETTPLPPGVTPSPTLQAGVQWHTVQRDETMLSIAFTYGANAEILSQLNPEVRFLQCDFEFDTGGPRCIVQLFEGQRLRVPAPTATPTVPPTPSGSETPTPTATPTYNAPNALSPGDRALFQRDQLVTLRWVTTASLGAEQTYRVRVRDLTLNTEYTADTRELFLIVPSEWQGTDARRHEYEWSVSVIDFANPDAPVFTTTPRIFIWESRAGSTATP